MQWVISHMHFDFRLYADKVIGYMQRRIYLLISGSFL